MFLGSLSLDVFICIKIKGLLSRAASLMPATAGGGLGGRQRLERLGEGRGSDEKSGCGAPPWTRGEQQARTCTPFSGSVSATRPVG